MLRKSVTLACFGLGLGALGCMMDQQDTGTNTGRGPEPGTVAPMLVEVDTDRTLSVDAGQGVGVFVQYQSGGRWTIRWTCDTSVTGEVCPTAMRVDAPDITEVQASRAVVASGTQATSTLIAVDVVTSTTEDAVAFRTPPGATITLTAEIAGLYDGSYFFFVQNGVVNGGYAGRLSNPLMLRGRTP